MACDTGYTDTGRFCVVPGSHYCIDPNSCNGSYTMKGHAGNWCQNSRGEGKCDGRYYNYVVGCC